MLTSQKRGAVDTLQTMGIARHSKEVKHIGITIRSPLSRHTNTAKFINKCMILWAGITEERIDCSQSIPMNFIINHALHRVAEHLHCNSPFIEEAQ